MEPDITVTDSRDCRLPSRVGNRSGQNQSFTNPARSLVLITISIGIYSWHRAAEDCRASLQLFFYIKIRGSNV